MTYATGSLSSANPAADLYAAMAAALTTAGFTLEDTVVISTRTHKIWKSAAGSNSQGLDWYLDVAYTTTGAGNVWLNVFEGYNAGTDQGVRGGYNSSSDTTTPEATYYSRYGATGSALETNWSTISNNIAQAQTSTSSFAYWFSATTDRVILMTSVQAQHVYYAGLFDMYAPWASKIGGLAYPLIACTVNNPTSTTDANSGSPHNNVSNMPNPPTATSSVPPAAITRRPPVATIYPVSSASYGGICICSVSNETSVSGSYSGGSGYGSPTNYVDSGASPFHDATRGGKLVIHVPWDLNNRGIVIGTLKDLNVFASLAATRGDTVTISGVDWVLSSTASPGSGGRCYGFKAA